MASMRFRIFIPAKALEERGHEVEIVFDSEKCDYMIFSKHFNKQRDQLLMAAANKNGIKTVYDVCDNHYNTPMHSEYYRDMSRAADIVTCNTLLMQKAIKAIMGIDAVVVEDSYDTDLPIQEARFVADENPLRIFWYGHFTNLNTLPGLVHQLEYLEEQVELKVVSNGPKIDVQRFENVEIEYHPWSGAHMNHFLEWCNFIAIPTLLNDPTKQTKSHNRATDGIRAGRFVIAHPLPSYEIYRDKYAWIGEDLSDGIIWADNNPKEALVRIQEGQKYIQENLSPDKIAGQWEKALRG